MTTLVTLTAGQSFGELALVEENGKRAATIITSSEVECLTIEGDVYRNQLARIHREEILRKVDVLRHQPTFSGWNAKDLEHLASIMLVQKVPYNTVIIEQDNETDALYFIKSGEVRIVRRMRPTRVVYINDASERLAVLAIFEGTGKRPLAFLSRLFDVDLVRQVSILAQDDCPFSTIGAAHGPFSRSGITDNSRESDR